MKRVSLWGALFAIVLAIATQAAFARAIDTKRFELAEQYMMLMNAKEYKKAYGLLAWKISYTDFLARVESSNKAFAEQLSEQGVELQSRKVERVTPMTFEDKYIIVNVDSSFTGTRKGTKEKVTDTVHYQVYFRFNEKGLIDLVNGIGEGWMC